MTQRYQGYTAEAPDGFMQPRRMKATYECLRCGGTYSRIYVTLPKRDPPCPKAGCKKLALLEEISREEANMAQIIEQQRAPASHGGNIQVRAIDETARIVMEDHKMTDLKDGVRTGDSIAPSLPGAMQSAADNFFNPKAQMAGRMNQRQMDLMGRRAMAGAFRNMAINPGAVVPGKTGESGLTQIGTERIK